MPVIFKIRVHFDVGSIGAGERPLRRVKLDRKYWTFNGLDQSDCAAPPLISPVLVHSCALPLLAWLVFAFGRMPKRQSVSGPETASFPMPAQMNTLTVLGDTSPNMNPYFFLPQTSLGRGSARHGLPQPHCHCSPAAPLAGPGSRLGTSPPGTSGPCVSRGPTRTSVASRVCVADLKPP